MHDLDWFWQSDRIVTVLHVAGGRGAAIHQLITFSPEVPKRKTVEVHGGAAHINQEGLGYIEQGGGNRHWHMHERWSGQGEGTWPRSAMTGKSLDEVRSEISALRTRQGEALADAVARGGVLTYRCYPGLDDGGIIWPNRRVVAVYHTDIGRSLREWYHKGLDVGIADWQTDHLSSMGISLASGTVLDYYTISHGGGSPDRTGHRGYLRSCLPEMARNQERMLAIPGVLAINVNEFFNDDWESPYLRLCEHCGITPNMQMATKFMDKYLSQQWRRGDA